GAKQYIILLEFLIESVILCIVGGAVGLLTVYAFITLLSGIIDFELFLSWNNILLGLICSVLVGVVSGLLPALKASRMDPVVAIRQ
ncbi:MAG: FtsX-like permease family protein, partial [Saprospiraceae bacterium]|nr:FtsX-like permease family protein [Saprospiraceae bacterium]